MFMFFFFLKTLSTMRVGERLFSGVNSHVVFKGFLTCITISTLSASERLLSSVSSHVDFNVWFLSKSLSTLRATVMPASHCKRKQGVSSAEAVRMQSRSSARPLPFHTGSVCSARLNSVFCTEWANSNLILNTIGLDLLLE